jgi:hypothetical protein
MKMTGRMMAMRSKKIKKPFTPSSSDSDAKLLPFANQSAILAVTINKIEITIAIINNCVSKESTIFFFRKRQARHTAQEQLRRYYKSHLHKQIPLLTHPFDDIYP